MNITDNKINVIAIYLPQFHPTPENDEWWGKGFTEWTNVGKAKALFRGHYQPKVPADLGYYDLRLPETRMQQAELAKEAGIDAFCYYHYWFGNGRRQLERPFNEVLESGKPDLPFMLCWANESWHSKFWNIDGKLQKKMLMEQLYPGDEDIKQHFQAVLPAFRDKRYVCVDGKPVFLIYRFEEHPHIERFIAMWQEMAHDVGLPGIYFVTFITANETLRDVDEVKKKGFDAVTTWRLQDAMREYRKTKLRLLNNRYVRMLLRRPLTISYKKFVDYMLRPEDRREDVFPTLYPNWDNTPRHGVGGQVVTDTTPEVFERHARQVLSYASTKKNVPNLVFVRAWNEWGEGNYMEPDLKYGKGYIKALRRVLDEIRLKK